MSQVILTLSVVIIKRNDEEFRLVISLINDVAIDKGHFWTCMVLRCCC